jgi:hypothetical protein
MEGKGEITLKNVQSLSFKTTTWLFLLFSLVYAMLVHFPISAYACDCVPPDSVETELSQSDAVFSGKVISIKEKRSSAGYIKKEIIFEVYQTWKGVEESHIKITSGQGGGDCGYHFVTDGEYLVYGRNSDMFGKSQLNTGICDKTIDLEAAIEDLKILGKGDYPDKQVTIDSVNSLDNLIDIDSKDQRWILHLIVFIIFFIGVFGFTTWRNIRKS